MKFIAVFILAIFAVATVRADSDDCTEERAESCINGFVSAVVDDAAEEEICKELRSSVSCLKDAVNDCMGDESDPEIDEGLEELEKILKENCEAGDSEDSSNSENEDDEEMAKCFEENEDYIFECVNEGAQQAITAVLEKGEVNENIVKCTMYGMMARCFVERVGEKCGETAATMADEELSDLPSEIKEACDEAGEVETYVFNLLEDKKRK